MLHKTISIALTLLAGVLRTSVALRSQMPSVGPQWEYAVVTGGSGFVKICYAMSYGGKTEKSGGRGEENDPVMSAATKLGEKGWELASAAEVRERNVHILYFKRLKSVINRNDDRR